MSDVPSRSPDPEPSDTVAPDAVRMPFPPPLINSADTPDVLEEGSTGAPPFAPRTPSPPLPLPLPAKKTSSNLTTVLSAALGSVIVGVTLPVLMVCYHNANSNINIHGYMQVAIIIAYLEIAATIVCGPGAVLLSVLLLIYMSRRRDQYADSHQLVTASMWRGAVISFLNFPGLLAMGLVGPEDSAMPVVRIIAMFLVAGASSGAWVGWQVYRQSHPDTPLLPRYRLSTLLLLVIAWGALMGIFAPTSKY